MLTALPALHRVSQSPFSPVECRRRESLSCDARRPASCRPWRRAARVAHATNIRATLWTHVGKSETIYKRVMHMLGAKSRACRSPRSTPLPIVPFYYCHTTGTLGYGVTLCTVTTGMPMVPFSGDAGGSNPLVRAFMTLILGGETTYERFHPMCLQQNVAAKCPIQGPVKHPHGSQHLASILQPHNAWYSRPREGGVRRAALSHHPLPTRGLSRLCEA